MTSIRFGQLITEPQARSKASRKIEQHYDVLVNKADRIYECSGADEFITDKNQFALEADSQQHNANAFQAYFLVSGLPRELRPAAHTVPCGNGMEISHAFRRDDDLTIISQKITTRD